VLLLHAGSGSQVLLHSCSEERKMLEAANGPWELRRAQEGLFLASAKQGVEPLWVAELLKLHAFSAEAGIYVTDEAGNVQWLRAKQKVHHSNTMDGCSIPPLGTCSLLQ